MRRLRNRGPSGAELVRQTQVRRLLCRYGAYSRAVGSKSSSSLECSSSSMMHSRSSKLAASSSSIQLASASARRMEQMRHEGDGDLKLALNRPSQLLAQDYGHMDKGLALAAAQYVSRILGTGESDGVDAQQLKEDFLHQLERDWGFTGAECLSLGRIKITIKRRDDELQKMRRVAEMERAELEKNRLMQERGAQLRTRMENVSSSSSHRVQSTQSTTKVVKTRVVKTVKRTVQTVRAA